MIIWGIIFFLYTPNINKPGCDMLPYYSRLSYKFYFIAGAIYIVVFSTLNYFAYSKEPENKAIKISLIGLKIGMGIAVYVLFILLLIAYNKDEPCGGLRTLILVYAIM